MATPAVDTSYIAASYSISEPTLQALLVTPSPEQIQELLAKIEEKAREHESVQAEKLRSDVELETAVQNGNRRTKQLKESVDKGLKEVEELRKKLSDEETTRASLESELHNLKSSTSSSGSEVQALNSRISSLEASNRDALSLLEKKSTDHDKLADELSTQQQKAVALRRDLAVLEEKLQTAENASMSAKFREQSLQQEVELLKKNNEWHEKELKHRGTEHTKYRKEKGAQISELQRSLEDVTQANETLRSTETTLRNRLDELTRKLEDAYVQIQTKDEDAIKREDAFRAELDNAVRLSELQRKSADTARARQHELESAMDQLREEAATEIGNLQADINAERSDREAAERRVAELEAQKHELEGELAGAQHTPSRPSTPRRGTNGVGAHSTPGRNGSPGLMATPGGSRLKGSLTVTQIYSEYSKVKSELEAERRDAQALRTQIDEMIEGLENSQPQVEELREENRLFEERVNELTSLLDEASKDRDNANKKARKWEGTCSGLAAEADLLRQQLRDLSTQVKILLVEVQAREQGLDAMSAEERAQLEQVARGELMEGLSATGQIISDRLVIFRNVSELQKRNEELLRSTRHFGELLEGDEAKAKRNQQALDQEELESLRTRILEYQDKIKSLTTMSKSYIHERDMFRRILGRRGQLPPDADLEAIFGQSVDGSIMPATPSRAHSVEPSADARALSDHIKLLKEMQQHFDAYREEASTDHQSLKQQVDQLSKQKSELQSENARHYSQLTLTREQYGMLKSNYEMLQTENRELQKRTQVISENAAKQDIRTQQVAEELVEAKGLVDSMRHESANLKAEKELWKRIEERRTQEYDTLTAERNRLSKMLSDVQSLQNERDLENSETRRRLQSRVDGLESELSSIKRKLEEEVEQSKKAALRREYEHEQNRTRIEDLLKSSANYKEELVEARTQRDSLQSQVDGLKVELRNAEEKAQALQPRPTTRPGGQENDENALTHEQELAVEVADLKRDLDLKLSEVQQAREEIEQYKSIAQAAEEALQSINETNDQYREETDQVLAENDIKIRELERRVEEISSELANAHTELSETRSKAEEATSKLNEEKARYESEIARLRDEGERLAETARLHQQDLKAQAEIAQQAQQNYEDELVKHANATSMLHKVREQYNQVKTEVASSKAEAESARVSLAQNEESWVENRNQYEQEIRELKNRREEVKTQNERLMQQFKDVSSQIAALKQNRATNGEESARAGTPAGGSDSNLQEIISYLREEKNITEVQKDLCQRESDRLKVELEHTKAQLEQTREKLEEERRSQVAKEQNAATHSKLMQTINELNLNRESNTTLRSQYESAQKQLNQKIKEVEDLIAQLEPVQTRVREVEHELESKNGELKLLQEDRDRWQKRTQDIMQKYDRVDPEELEGFKTQISSLEAERETLLAAKQELESGLEEKITAAQEERNKFWEERRAKLIEQSKNKVRDQNEIIKNLKAQLETTTEDKARISLELTAANEELSRIRNELEQTRVARDQVLEQASQKAPTPVDAGEEGQVHEGLSEEARAEYETRIATIQAQASAEAEKVAILEQEMQRVQAQAQGLNGQVETLQQNLDAAHAEISALQATNSTPQQSNSSEELQKVKAELEAKQGEIEALKATAHVAASMSQADGTKSVTELVKEQVDRISNKLTTEHNQRVSESEERFQKRAEAMKTQLNKKLADGKQSIRDQEKVEHDKAMDQLKSEHVTELERLRAEHQEEIQRLSAQAGTVPSTGSTESNGTTADTNGKWPAAWTPSTEQIKDFVNTNPHVKRIINGNITKQKDNLVAQIKREEEIAWADKLKETLDAANEAKEKAVELASKKVQVKLNMLEGRQKTAQAQLEVVKRCAGDTPQRPVAEVWEIAKAAKSLTTPRPAATPSTTPSVPVPVAQQQQPLPAPQQANVAPTPSPAPTAIVVQATPSVNKASAPQNNTPDSQLASSNGPPTGPSQVTTGGFGAPSVGPGQVPVGGFGAPSSGFGAPSGGSAVRGTSPFATPGQQPPRGSSPFANPGQQPPPGPNMNQQQQQSNMPRPAQAAGTGPAALRGIVGQTQHPALNQALSSGIPRPGTAGGMPRGPGYQQHRGGMHPQAQQQQHGFGQQQQNIPVAGAARGGSHLPRGPGGQRGGRGGGRGQQVQTQQQGSQQQGGPNSPGGRGGSLNPGARQFNPGAGNKRPHEGGEGGNAEKKARGQGE